MAAHSNTGNNAVAWNDPPLFAYEASPVPNKAAPGLKLTKRVPFPQSSNAATAETSQSESDPQPIPGTSLLPPPLSATPPSAVTLLPPTPPTSSFPPPLTPVCPLVVNPADSTSEASANDEFDSEEAWNLINTVLASLVEKCTPTLEKRTLEDVQKKLNILETMWKDGKLNQDVQKKMQQLCQALSSSDFENANHIHMGLMVDHVSICSSWMVGVKHLIHQGKVAEVTSDKEQE